MQIFGGLAIDKLILSYIIVLVNKITEENMSNKTYEYYGKVLKNTPFENDRKEAYLPYSEDLSALKKEFILAGRTLNNRIEYQPMEAQDSLPDGSPSETTFERYKKLARGGASILWFEAVSICREGRSNPRQLEITDENVDVFARLVSEMKSACYESCGFEPIIIMQMNHSGRYSKPEGTPAPITAYYNPDIDSEAKLIATDEYLDSLVPKFIHTALLAEKAGFDGIDTKACHGYLMSELLSAYDREGKYGGSFENRSRLFRDVCKGVNESCKKEFIRAARINVFDGYPCSKYSFGRNEESDELYDLTEAKLLADIFEENGGQILNVTMGSPYRNPDVSRPYRKGLDTPKSNAIYALSRLWSGAAEIKATHSFAVVNTGVSLLGEFSPEAAAGAVKENMTDFVGFGRMSFAYPELAGDILSGTFQKARACVCCGGCSYLKKNLCEAGCIARSEYYKEIFKNYRRTLGGK